MRNILNGNLFSYLGLLESSIIILMHFISYNYFYIVITIIYLCMYALTLLDSEKISLKISIFVITAEVTEISEGQLNIVFDSGHCCLQRLFWLDHN